MQKEGKQSYQCPGNLCFNPGEDNRSWEDKQKKIPEVEGAKQSNTGVKQGTKA